MEGERPAPEWRTAFWLNAAEQVTLASLRGRPVFALAFQMLCPGCVSHGLPQAGRVRAAFAEDNLAVVALHTVFEHHEAQGTRAALEAFSHEYRIGFPIGMDAPHAGGGPGQTMRAYGMRGTPTILLFDRAGQLRLQHFGHLDDLRLGAAITQVATDPVPHGRSGADAAEAPCSDEGCLM